MVIKGNGTNKDKLTIKNQKGKRDRVVPYIV